MSVCDAWLEFKTFHDWAIANGYKEGLSIDRMDNDKGYSPENCQWATRKTQSRNKRTTIVISHKGKTMKLVEWAEHLRVKPSMLRLRIKRGWTIDKVLYVKEKGARI